jgi:DNA-binding Lrp family transcriptional regulator
MAAVLRMNKLDIEDLKKLAYDGRTSQSTMADTLECAAVSPAISERGV